MGWISMNDELSGKNLLGGSDDEETSNDWPHFDFWQYFVDEKDPARDQKGRLFWVKDYDKISVKYFFPVCNNDYRENNFNLLLICFHACNWWRNIACKKELFPILKHNHSHGRVTQRSVKVLIDIELDVKTGTIKKRTMTVVRKGTMDGWWWWKEFQERNSFHKWRSPTLNNTWTVAALGMLYKRASSPKLPSPLYSNTCKYPLSALPGALQCYYAPV